MIIIEGILTIWAWNVGWRAKSLLPMSIEFVIGVLIGMMITLFEWNFDKVMSNVSFISFITIGILIFMIVKKNKSSEDDNHEV